MLCCPLLLDMACHTTWYWHPCAPPACPRSRWGWGCGPTMISRRGSSVGVFCHPSHWTIPHCDDPACCSKPLATAIFFSSRLTWPFYIFHIPPRSRRSKFTFNIEFWAFIVLKESTSKTGQMLHRWRFSLLFSHMSGHSFKIGVSHFSH